MKKLLIAAMGLLSAGTAEAQCLQGATVGCGRNPLDGSNSLMLVGQQQIAPNAYLCTYKTLGFPAQLIQRTYEGGCPLLETRRPGE